MRYIGRDVKKMDGPALLRGSAKFVDDIKLPGMSYLGFTRSPLAHALIKRVDTARASRMRGVLSVLTGEDVKRIMKPYPPFFKDFPGLRYAECYPLAIDRVRFAGEPVVAVVAEDRYTLDDALEAIEVEYEELPVLTEPEEAMKPGSPLIYPEWGDNVMFRFVVRGGDVEAAFRKADIVLSEKLDIHRYTGTPIETRGYLAEYDAASGCLTLWASTQQPHPLRTMLADALGLPEMRIRVIQPHVGGGFGLKTPLYPEEALVCLLAMRIGRPVKWVETRREHLLGTGHARQQRHYVEVAVRRDGVVLGLRDKMIVDLGVFYPTHGQMQMYVTAKHIVGPYAIKNVLVEAYGVATNKTYYYAYRGFGKEAANFVYERVMDLVARELALDRAEVRLRNFIGPEEFPYKSPTGAVYDSGDYHAVLKKALDLVERQGFSRRREESRKRGRLTGLGFSFVLEPCGASVPDSYTQGYDAATVRVDPSGKVTVLTGITSPGTGNETAVAQVVADELGVRLEDVAVIQGDTSICPYGLGNFSSRAAIVGVSSALLAARAVKEKILRIAAGILEASADDLEVEDGYIHVRGVSGRGIHLSELARFVYKNIYLVRGEEPGLEATRYFLTPNVYHTPDEEGRINTYPLYPYAANVALVEVDPETYEVRLLGYLVVHDCGTLINPGFVDGQVVGGVAQGIGGALLEELVYDARGQLLTSSFMDYLIPSSMEIPEITVHHHETPSPFTPLGSKGCGEGGAEGVSAAIASAIEDALSGYGIRIRATPLTPDKIWRLLRESSS